MHSDTFQFWHFPVSHPLHYFCYFTCLSGFGCATKKQNPKKTLLILLPTLGTLALAISCPPLDKKKTFVDTTPDYRYSGSGSGIGPLSSSFGQKNASPRRSLTSSRRPKLQPILKLLSREPEHSKRHSFGFLRNTPTKQVSYATRCWPFEDLNFSRAVVKMRNIHIMYFYPSNVKRKPTEMNHHFFFFSFFLYSLFFSLLSLFLPIFIVPSFFIFHGSFLFSWIVSWRANLNLAGCKKRKKLVDSGKNVTTTIVERRTSIRKRKKNHIYLEYSQIITSIKTRK